MPCGRFWEEVSAKEFFVLSDIIILGFNSTEFTFIEDSGTNAIPVSLLSGNLGDFTVFLTANTDSDTTTATGEFVDHKIF